MNHIHWDQTKIEDALTRFFDKSPKPPVKKNGTIYKIQEAFKDFDYWIHKTNVERFRTTMQNGILYRADIVNELVDKVDEAFGVGLKVGVMVAGPHGVGKSHSLVNLVLALRHRGQLVTFIPDCGSWRDPHWMINMICGSFGTTMEEVFTGGGAAAAAAAIPVTEDVDAFVRIVTRILGDLNKRWVFVFDQVNYLFSRDKVTKIAELTKHHQMISEVWSFERVVSVISASANNEIADDHSGFITYNHRSEMDEAELSLIFPQLANNENLAQDVKGAAGRHPYYVALYLEDQVAFQKKVYHDVRKSVEGLLKRWNNKMVKESIVLCVLQQSRDDEGVYDRKFMVASSSVSSQTTTFLPIIPTVVAAYRNDFWNDIMNYVMDREEDMLRVCSFSTTTQDVRGRLFEAVVIGKTFSAGLDFLWDEHTISLDSGRVHHFSGSKLPRSVVENFLYVPDNPNFTAIDFFLLSRNLVVAFQVHTSGHPDVGPTFLGMCCEAGWLKDKNTDDLPERDLPDGDGDDQGDDTHNLANDVDYTVLLVYLSPNDESKRRVGQHVMHGVVDARKTRSQTHAKRIYVVSMCLKDFPGSLSSIAYR